MHLVGILGYRWLSVQHGSENGEDMLVYLELYMMSTLDILHDEDSLAPMHCITTGKGREISFWLT